MVFATSHSHDENPRTSRLSYKRRSNKVMDFQVIQVLSSKCSEAMLHLMPHNLHSAAATIPATSWGIFRVPLISVHRLATICEKTWRKKYETWLAAYESKLKTTRDSSDRSMSVESNVTEVVLARGDTLVN